jgi:hypothetical protein
MCVVAALYVHFHEQLVWLSTLVIINLAMLLIVGNYFLRSIFFPYSNFFIRKQLDSLINKRFS